MKEKVISVKKISKENHKQRAYLNSITSILDYAGNQIVGFITSPFIVNGLGNSMYGIYQMLNQMTGYANIADTRASQVLKWTVAQKRDIASQDELRSELTTALVVTSVTLPIILLFGAVLTWYAPIISQSAPQYFGLVRITCALMISSLIIYQAFSVFESLLRGMNLGYKGMGIRTVVVGLSGLLKVLVIQKGYGLVGLGIVQVFIAFLTAGAFYLIIKKNIPWFGFGKTDKAKVLSYSKISGWFMGLSFSNMALMHSDKLILGYLIGPEYVTVFVLTLFTIKAMEGIINAVISGIIPGVGKFFGNGEFDKVKEARTILTSLTWLLVTSIGVTILLYNRSFLELWVGNDKYAGNVENLLLLVIGIQYIFFYMDGNFINVTLDMATKVILTAVSSLVTVSLAFILVEKYGIIGMCMSILLGRIILSIGYPIILKKKLGEDFVFFDKRTLHPVLTSMLFLLIASKVSTHIYITSWINLCIAGVVTATLLIPLYWIVGLPHKNRILTLSRLKKVKFLG